MFIVVAKEVLRFILEVAGASGAVWGSSEVMERRNDLNNEEWRLAAVVVGTFAFMAYTMEHVAKRYSSDVLRNSQNIDAMEEQETSTSVIPLSLGQKIGLATGASIGVLLRLVLDIGGATGAIWGASEVYEWRDEGNEESWRAAAQIVRYFSFALFLAEQCESPASTPLKREDNFWTAFLLAKKNPGGVMNMLRTTSASANSAGNNQQKDVCLSVTRVGGVTSGLTLRLVLEVFGATGAIWGNSEIFDIRHNAHYKRMAQIVAIVVGVLAFSKQIGDAYTAKPFSTGENDSDTTIFWKAKKEPYATIKDLCHNNTSLSENLLPSSQNDLAPSSSY